MAKILPGLLEPDRPALLSSSFFDLSLASKFTPCRRAGFLERHARGKIALDERFEMRAQLVIHLGFVPLPANEPNQPNQHGTKGIHGRGNLSSFLFIFLFRQTVADLGSVHPKGGKKE
jgi:hypothetical protein